MKCRRVDGCPSEGGPPFDSTDLKELKEMIPFRLTLPVSAFLRVSVPD